MKNSFLAVFAFFLFAHVGFSNTYVWEDYDDFSGSSLDTSKWDVGYFSGGNVASTNGSVATLSGSGYTGSDLENVPPIWQTAAAQSSGQSNSGIFVKETDIYGIEVEVSIPSSGNSQNVGFIVETHPSDGSTYNGIELAWRENGLYWSFENENPSNAQILDLSQEADFDTSYTLSVIHTGSRMELHINGTRVANLNSNFTPNHWLIGSFNDDGKTFNVSIDNVRVLRPSTSDSLDGTTLFLDSDDPVTLTLAFENGTITSTFEDGGEDSATETGIQYDYIIVDQNRFSITDTSKLDGSYITFDQSTGRGKLFDFKSDGQIDESGTWEFSFQSFDLAVQPLSIRASRDLLYLQTPSGPTEIEGAGEIAFELELFDQPNITNLSLTIDGQTYSLSSDQKPSGFSLEYGYKDPSKPKELFDLESASDSDWTAYENQTTFAFSLTVDGAEYSYSHNLPAESELPQHASISVNGDHTWKKDTEGYDYVEILKNDSYQFSWDAFSSTDSKDYIVVHLQELVGDDDVQIIPEVILDAGETSYTVDGSYFEAGKKYAFFVELMNVTEQQNPNGFTHTSGSDTSLPLLQTTARMVTALDLMVIEGKVVVSAPTGLPVVVQLADKYNWSDSLDGVTLWSVSGSESEGNWDALTAKFSGGKLIYGFEFADDVSDTGANTAPYEIDENGYIKSLEGDGDYQYYNVVSVEDGVIGTIQNDQGVESVADNGVNQVDQWFFTTRADAEEFYNSKINYAPESLVGYTLTFDENETSPGSTSYGESIKYFMEDMVFGLEEGQLEGVPYSYHVAESIPSIQAVIVFQHDENSTTTFEVTFSSHTHASGTWTEQDGTDQITGTIALEVATVDIAPASLTGLTYLNEMNDFLSFFEQDLGTFYSENESNFSNSEVSNITYSWEKIGPNIGVLTTSLDETTYLFFESPPEGFGVESTFLGSFVWMEEPGGESEFGIFTISHIEQGLAPLDLAGENLVLGPLSMVFFEDSIVHITEGGETIAGSYAFTRYGEDILILSIYGEDSATPKVYKLDFKSEGTGDFIGSASGSFKYTKNWAMKGWVWYDKFPWSFSSNQGDWLYQVLFLNDNNETNLAYYEAWSKKWKILDELDYGGETNFSASESFAWAAYDDFNTSALDSSKWDVAWWDGGTSPTVDLANNRVVFNKGTTYEANLSALMNETNSDAESEYGRGNESNAGKAPSTIADLVAKVASIQTVPEEENYGMEEVYFDGAFRYRWDSDDQQEIEEPYIYSRTSPDTATISIEQADGPLTLELTFNTDVSGTGTWTDIEGGETYSGTLTFDLLYTPHSLLEFRESDEVQGIEIELMIPSNAPDKTCIGLFAVDYEQMFNAGSDEEEEGAIKFDLDLCYFDNSLKMEFNCKDLSTNEEVSLSRDVALGDYQKVAFYYEEDQLSFYHNEELAVTIDYVRGFEQFIIRAQNETNTDFSAYLRNVRVLKQKPYPQGWMWMHYYPWAYSYDSGNWLYFRTAKDIDGQPSMIYWDESSEEWDLYFPVLSSSQNDEKETADKLLEQHD